MQLFMTQTPENYLPWPRTEDKVREHLKRIDDRFLNCTEKFIRLQVKEPVGKLIKKTVFPIDSPQAMA